MPSSDWLTTGPRVNFEDMAAFTGILGVAVNSGTAAWCAMHAIESNQVMKSSCRR